jgi:sugar fermentation stimulation protein A
LPLEEAVLVRRYKRFLADVRLENGSVRTVHVANPGAMTGLARAGRRVLISDSGNPGRALRWNWELVRIGRCWVCVNTAIANRVVRHWLESGRLYANAGAVQAEPRWGDSRFDFAVGSELLIEVKSVTLADDGIGAFPDAVTDRSRRHLERLAAIRDRRRVLLYFVARADVRCVRPADEIDPAYGDALRRAAAAGVEIRAIGARFDRRGAHWNGELEVRL